MPVRRHRIGDQMPAVIHPDPDPAAINVCRDLMAETDASASSSSGPAPGAAGTSSPISTSSSSTRAATMVT